MAAHDDDFTGGSLAGSFGIIYERIEDKWHMLMGVLSAIKMMKTTQANHKASVGKLQESLNVIMDDLTKAVTVDYPEKGFYPDTALRLIQKFVALEQALGEEEEVLKKENVEAVEQFVDRLVVNLIEGNQKEMEKELAGHEAHETS